MLKTKFESAKILMHEIGLPYKIIYTAIPKFNFKIQNEFCLTVSTAFDYEMMCNFNFSLSERMTPNYVFKQF